jgi:hypothetical protein
MDNITDTFLCLIRAGSDEDAAVETHVAVGLVGARGLRDPLNDFWNYRPLVARCYEFGPGGTAGNRRKIRVCHPTEMLARAVSFADRDVYMRSVTTCAGPKRGA